MCPKKGHILECTFLCLICSRDTRVPVDRLAADKRLVYRRHNESLNGPVKGNEVEIMVA